MEENTYTVEGITCSCCSSKVTEAVSEIDGVENVEVDIKTGELTVSAEEHVDDTSIRDAISGIGYEMTR